jgi:hypothetical protein
MSGSNGRERDSDGSPESEAQKPAAAARRNYIPVVHDVSEDEEHGSKRRRAGAPEDEIKHSSTLKVLGGPLYAAGK